MLTKMAQEETLTLIDDADGNLTGSKVATFHFKSARQLYLLPISQCQFKPKVQGQSSSQDLSRSCWKSCQHYELT